MSPGSHPPGLEGEQQAGVSRVGLQRKHAPHQVASWGTPTVDQSPPALLACPQGDAPRKGHPREFLVDTGLQCKAKGIKQSPEDAGSCENNM